MLAAAAPAVSGPASMQQSRVAGQQQVVAKHQALPVAVGDPDPGLKVFVECAICQASVTDPMATPSGISFCQPCTTELISGHTAGTGTSTSQPLSVQQLAPVYELAALLEEMGRLSVNLAAEQQQQQQQQQQTCTTSPMISVSTSTDLLVLDAPALPIVTVAAAPAPVPAPPSVTVQQDPKWQELEASKGGPQEEADSEVWNQLAEFLEDYVDTDLRELGVANQAAGIVALFQRAEQTWGIVDSLCKKGSQWDLLQLDLSDHKIGDAGATALAQHAALAPHWPSLRSLNLVDSGVGDAGVTALAQHAAQHWTNLQSLNLGGNGIGISGVIALAQHAARHLPNLRILYLGGNSIGAAGATALAHAAQHWINLESLDLFDNGIRDEGASALAQHAAQHWPNLQSLNLGGNGIGDAGITALAQHAIQHLTSLQSLDLTFNSIGDEGASALAGHAAGTWPYWAGPGTRGPVQLQRLKHLDLSRNIISAEGKAELSDWARWRFQMRVDLII